MAKLSSKSYIINRKTKRGINPKEKIASAQKGSGFIRVNIFKEKTEEARTQRLVPEDSEFEERERERRERVREKKTFSASEVCSTD